MDYGGILIPETNHIRHQMKQRKGRADDRKQYGKTLPMRHEKYWTESGRGYGLGKEDHTGDPI